MTGCVGCGGIDADIELGWTICGTCFHQRLAEPVVQWPSPWINAAKVVSVLMFMVALLFLAGALGALSAHADTAIPSIDYLLSRPHGVYPPGVQGTWQVYAAHGIPRPEDYCGTAVSQTQVPANCQAQVNAGMDLWYR